MNTEAFYWFHCATCGELFSGKVDFSADRLCPVCGGKPAPSPEPAPLATDVAGEAAIPFEQAQFVPERRQSRIAAKWKVLFVWLVLMGAVFLIARMVSSDNQPQEVIGSQGQSANQEKTVLKGRDQDLLEQVLPACRQTLGRFLSAQGVDEQRSLVLPRPDLAARMERHYSDNSLLEADPDTMTLIAGTFLDLPEGRTVLTQWETEEGASFDAAFRQVGEEWRLDWEHFARYSDLSWALFLAGSGEEDEAEFRLHARRRMASEGDPRNGIGVVLSAPLRRHMEEVGYSQSMQGLSLNGADGTLLQLAFARAESGIPLFGAGCLDVNPEGKIRVRVRVKRMSEDGGLKCSITKVMACHWYDSKATGMETISQD